MLREHLATHRECKQVVGCRRIAGQDGLHPESASKSWWGDKAVLVLI
jgi:hypothetical protein